MLDVVRSAVELPAYIGLSCGRTKVSALRARPSEPANDRHEGGDHHGKQLDGMDQHWFGDGATHGTWPSSKVNAGAALRPRRRRKNSKPNGRTSWRRPGCWQSC